MHRHDDQYEHSDGRHHLSRIPSSDRVWRELTDLASLGIYTIMVAVILGLVGILLGEAL